MLTTSFQNGPMANQSFLPGGRSLIRTQMVYDGNGRLTTLIDDRNNETSYNYDLLASARDHYI